MIRRTQAVIDLATDKLAELLEYIATAEAGGENVTRLNSIAQRAETFLAAAEEAWAAGDAVVALERASRALQAATNGAQRLGMTHQHQHMNEQQAGDTHRQRRQGS